MICPRCHRETLGEHHHCNAGGDGTRATIPYVGVLTPPPSDVELTRLANLAAPDGTGAPAATTLGGVEAATMAAVPRTPSPLPSTLGFSSGAPILVDGHDFAGRYHVIRQIGTGGMGAVYHAWDEKLGISVAVKVIRPEITASPTEAAELERRFKRELLLARQVTHANVIRIHDLGEVGGTTYITMPYVEGENLATIVGKGKMPVSRALQIARQIASGLAAAHGAGVIHRDLKPGNVMVDASDNALLMDFGIARSAKSKARPVEPAGLSRQPAGAHDATVLGSVVGTLQYMAPEQARGEHVDHRADIYAFGLILYEMLTGLRRLPDTPSVLGDLQARMQKAPAGVRTLDPDIPEPVELILDRCVAPDPAARYATTDELVRDLNALDADGHPLPQPRRLTRRLVAAVFALVLGLLGGTWWVAKTRVPPPPPAPVSVLIADFENRTGVPAFGGSLEQALRIGIEGASFINSFPRPDAHAIARQLNSTGTIDEKAARLISIREGIKVMLTGVIERRGDRYEASVGVVDVSGAKPPQVFTASAGNVDQLLRAIPGVAAKVRTALGDSTPESEQLARAETFTTSSLEAVQNYTIAQELAYAEKDDEAIGYFRRAIDLDPSFGRAYAGWALSATHLGRKEEASELWKKTLALLDRMSEREKYRTYGIYYSRVVRDNDRAIDNYKTLLQKYPGDATGHGNLAVAYFRSLDFAKAMESGRRAVELMPRSLRYRLNFVLYGMYAGAFKNAGTEAAKIVKDDQTDPYAYLPIAVAALDEGNVSAARDAYASMSKAGTLGASLANMGLADIALYRGEFAAAEKLLQAGVVEDERLRNSDLLGAKLNALAEARLGARRSDAALQAAERALKNGAADPQVAVPAARIAIQAGRIAQAKAIADQMRNSLRPQTRAYGYLIDGELALRERRYVEAIDALRSGLKLADLWLLRYTSAVAYVEAGAYAEALFELEQCSKRRGEAVAVFLDDVPSFRYLAAMPYWVARAQEGVGVTPAAIDNYTKYLDVRSGTDPLSVDARRRLAKLKSLPS